MAFSVDFFHIFCYNYVRKIIFMKGEAMKTVGIVCEYNPMHAGHKRQIDFARENGAECIVCVMSGNYTQRGELGIADKYTRAKAAAMIGADLVLELPFPFSSMSAEFFARAAVHILGSVGVDTICFGHECEDISTLFGAADIFLSESFKNTLSHFGGMGTAKGFFDAYREVSGDSYTLGSNDILGAYYIAAAKSLFPDMSFMPIRRNGADYKDDKLSAGILPSATAIRNSLRCGIDPSSLDENILPRAVADVLKVAQSDGIYPVYADSISGEILSYLRLLSPSDITTRAINISGGGTSVLDDGCGILSRISNQSFYAKNYAQLLSLSYNSKFTNARINRVLLFSLFGVSDVFKSYLPDYTNLLAASKTGREYLSYIRKSSDFNIVTKPADAPKDSPTYKTGRLADITYTAAMGKMTDAQYFLLQKPYIEK